MPRGSRNNMSSSNLSSRILMMASTFFSCGFVFSYVVSANDLNLESEEEKKELAQKKKDIRAEIKELESELAALGLKKSEIKKIRENAKGDVYAEDEKA